MSCRTRIVSFGRSPHAPHCCPPSLPGAGPEVPGETRYAITGATVHTVTHGDVANATLVFENGRIVSIEANGLCPRARR